MTRRISPLGLHLAYDGIGRSVSVDITGAASAAEAQAPASVTTEVNYTPAGAAAAGQAEAVTVIEGGGVTANVTGAAAAAQAGAVKAGEGFRFAQLSPLGLPLLYRGNVTVGITGAESAGEAGTVTLPGISFSILGASSPAQPGVVSPSVAESVKAQLGPLILSGPRRDIVPKGNNNVSVNITGAAIQGQWSTPDLADVSVYADGEDGLGQAAAPLVDDEVNETALLTGAEAAAEAGTMTVTSVQEVAITGAEAAAESGQATGIGTDTGNTNADITGVAIATGAGVAGSPDNAVAITGAAITTEVGPVGVKNPLGGILVAIPGVVMSGGSGSVIGSDYISVNVSGAEISADAGIAQGQFPPDVAASPVGAESVAEAGTPTFVFDSIFSISGAAINAQASEVGLDFKTGVSPTITGAAAAVLTSGVGFVNLYPIPVTGAEIQAQAYEIASGFGDEDLGLTNSTDRFNGLIAGLAVKAPCRTATLTNITLSGHQFINGLSLVTGDRVLVTAQTNAVDNGIYVVDSSDWERAADFDGNRDIVRGTLITVTEE